jgi:hypothetical protein
MLSPLQMNFHIVERLRGASEGLVFATHRIRIPAASLCRIVPLAPITAGRYLSQLRTKKLAELSQQGGVMKISSRRAATTSVRVRDLNTSKCHVA